MEQVRQVKGPRVSDERFFRELVDTTLPGMEGLAEAAFQRDYATCRKIFAKRVRDYLRPDLYEPIAQSFGNMMAANLKLEDIMNNKLTIQGISHQYGDVIDWNLNPTENNYSEWLCCLHRHPHWVVLAEAYKKTGDEAIAECFVRQFMSWVEQVPIPDDDPPTYSNETCTWQTIEVGQRMSGSMTIALHAFYKSPAFTDDVIVTYYKSIWEHGDRLIKWHGRFNWLMMEMNGLGQMGVLYRELRDSKFWYDFAVKTIRDELSRNQVYADGFQGELSSMYQNAVISHPMRAMLVAETYGMRMPQELYDIIEKLLEVYIKFVTPEWKAPPIGDSHGPDVPPIIAPYIRHYPHNTRLLWGATRGQSGCEPEYKSVVLPYSGYTVMRTGWGANDVYAYFDGGPFGINHQHQDKLNLVICANGHYVLPICGTYAYDYSDMRRYAISTRGHNCGRVNGLDQNRQWYRIIPPEELAQDSGMKTLLSDAFDYASAVYEDGYSNEYNDTAIQPSITRDGGLCNMYGEPYSLEKPSGYYGAKHRRSVMMVKEVPEGFKPFFLVFDRFESQDVNDYELLWHLDAEEVKCANNKVETYDFTILQTENEESKKNVLVKGETEPEWQGWKSHGIALGCYEPAWMAKTTMHGSTVKVISLLYTDSYENCPVERIETDKDPMVNSVKLILKNGKTMEISEPIL